MKIPKTKDRMLLGILAGGITFVIQSLFDYTSARQGISKRSYWTTAAGVWVSSRRQAQKWDGQLLGGWMTFGLNVLNGIFMVWMFTKAGLNKWAIKGMVTASAFGSAVNALLSGFDNNKVSPKDGSSNLSYALTHIISGLVASWSIITFGDKSLFNERIPIIATKEESPSVTPSYVDGSVPNETCPTYMQ